MAHGPSLGAAYQPSSTMEAERFFASLLTWAGVTLPVTVSGDAVEARYLEAGDDLLLFVFNHGAQPARSTVSLRRPRGGEYVATDLASGQPVKIDTATNANSVRLVVALDPHGVQVMKIAPR